MRSWFLDFLRHSRLLRKLGSLLRPKPAETMAPAAPKPAWTPLPAPSHRLMRAASLLIFAGLVLGLALGALQIILLFKDVTAAQWVMLIGKAFATLGRVMAAICIGLLWAVPLGLWIGLSPRLSRYLQPAIQVIASFPAPMIFPVAIILLHKTGVPLGVGSVFLMLLGVQWYILFNVVAGATAIPSDLKEAARVYRIEGWQRFRRIYLPGIFPYLVTGLVTASGGAWNASIVTEYVTFKGSSVTTWGLGSQINLAAAGADFPLLAASVVVMSVVVVCFNRLVWDRLCRLAEEKYSLSK
jgi:NitT/TauT family transport system permease protein